MSTSAPSQENGGKGQITSSESSKQFLAVPDDEDSSWVEVAPPSRDSGSSITTCTETGLEKLLIDAQRDDALPVSTKDSRHSPKSLQSPNVEFVANLEQVKIKLRQDMLPPGKNSDWIWDWSSRPEVIPPKEWKLRPAPQAARIGTPPNSPIPSPNNADRSYTSLRHSKLIRSKYFSVEWLSVLLVTNLVSLLIGAGIG